MSIWYTSDTHFNHTNIIEYCGRPFSDVNEMNEKIIYNWNSLVQPEDDVYHLGDFGLFKGGTKQPESFIHRLNGRIHLIRGNHDHIETRRAFDRDAGGTWITYGRWLHFDKNQIPTLMVHKPQNAPTDMFFKMAEQVILYGHVHEKAPKGLHLLEFSDGQKRLAYHVGVDTNDFKPVNEKTVEEELRYFVRNPAYDSLEVFKVGLPEKF